MKIPLKGLHETMNLEDRFANIDKWFESEEGKASVDNLLDEMEREEDLATELEAKSTLRYKDGQKVMRGDVFIDEYHEQLEEKLYGVTSYVHRINEDGTIDNCFSSCIAWKANNYQFDPERSRLVRRNGKLQSPFDNAVIEIE